MKCLYFCQRVAPNHVEIQKPMLLLALTKWARVKGFSGNSIGGSKLSIVTLQRQGSFNNTGGAPQHIGHYSPL